MISPRLRDHFHIEIMAPDHVVLLTEQGHRILHGRAYVQLVPLLDGRHTRDELVARLSGTVPLPELYYALGELARTGLAVEGDAPLPHRPWRDALGANPHEAADRLATRHLALHPLADLDPAPLAAALQASEIRLAADGEAGDLRVVLTDDYQRRALAAINAQQLATGQPWLLIKPVGGTLWLGPLFEPGQGACWRCLDQRLAANRQVESYLQSRGATPDHLIPPRATLPTTLQMAYHLATIELLKWLLTGANERLADAVLTFELSSATLTSHRLLRRPQCPACGDPAFLASHRQPRPPRLAPAPKRYTEEGGHRTVAPAETLARYQHHVSPITGLISTLYDRSDDDSLTHSFVAVHHFPMFKDDPKVLQKNLAGRSGGKGVSRTQAQVSAISEALERYSGVWRGDDEPVIHARARDLGPAALPLGECLGFSAAQYATRSRWNRALKNPHQVVPVPLDPDLPIDWAPLWPLRGGDEPRYLPAAYCYFGHPDLAHTFCLADTNGCAAGNSLEEALLQGLLELIERDSVALWWYNRVARPAVDGASFGLPYFHTLRAFYERANRDLWLLDLTADLGVPTIAALSARRDHPVEDIILGFGAHLDPKIALLRALTELNQSFPYVAQQGSSGRTLYRADNAEMLHWFKTVTQASDPYLRPDPQAAPRTPADFPRLAHDDLLDDLHWLDARLAAAGLEPFILDQTRPDVGMAVCRVVVPGLRHYWRRLGPGRLYEVPVRLGWLPHPHAEADLNPHSVFF